MSLSEITSVIWDLDGTLLYTLDDLKNSVNYALKSYGYPERTLEEIRKSVGNGIKNLVLLSIPNGAENPDFEKVFSLFQEHYKEHNLDSTRPYEGVQEVIKELSSRGIKQAIVSNKVDYAVKLLKDEFFEVDFAIGAQDNLERKPAPDMVLKAMEAINADKNKTVYIGDSEVDLKTAKNTGLPCVSVLWGFRTEEELMPFNPQIKVFKPEDILNVLL
ncbi:MAG: HAD family hydrolase [Oscillospiraceae bacterium]|nr:HAD family hydrolase [Oscillospiraceae bacterium]